LAVGQARRPSRSQKTIWRRPQILSGFSSLSSPDPERYFPQGASTVSPGSALSCNVAIEAAAASLVAGVLAPAGATTVQRSLNRVRSIERLVLIGVLAYDRIMRLGS
jgi:hypothetical protein